MSENILVCDKSIPFAGMVAGELRRGNSMVALAGTNPSFSETETDAPVSHTGAALCEVSWNRRSPLSSKTLLLETRNSLPSLDGALLLFDAQAFLASLDSAKISVSALLDEYVEGYIHLVHELGSFFQKQKKGRITFTVRRFPPRSALPGSMETVFAVAEAAFIRLAEETALYFSSQGLTPCPLILLGDGDDTEDAIWLAGKLSEPSTGKAASRGGPVRWVKAGSRNLLGLLS